MRGAFWRASPPQRIASITLSGGGVVDQTKVTLEAIHERAKGALGVDVAGGLAQDRGDERGQQLVVVLDLGAPVARIQGIEDVRHVGGQRRGRGRLVRESLAQGSVFDPWMRLLTGLVTKKGGKRGDA